MSRPEEEHQRALELERAQAYARRKMREAAEQINTHHADLFDPPVDSEGFQKGQKMGSSVLLSSDDAISPDFLVGQLAPYLKDLCDLQHLIDEMNGRAKQDIKITGISSTPKEIRPSLELTEGAVEVRVGTVQYQITGTPDIEKIKGVLEQITGSPVSWRLIAGQVVGFVEKGEEPAWKSVLATRVGVKSKPGKWIFVEGDSLDDVPGLRFRRKLLGGDDVIIPLKDTPSQSKGSDE